MKYCFILVFLIIGERCAFAQSSMDNDQLGQLIYAVSDTVEGNVGNWQFLIDSMPMFCLTDEFHNRMRIVTPVKKAEDLTEEELTKCMEANFHTALDVKYAISNDILWVAFIHPLKELTEEQALDAISQVYNASATFGTSYSSTDLVFPKREKKKFKKT